MVNDSRITEEKYAGEYFWNLVYYFNDKSLPFYFIMPYDQERLEE